MSGRQFLYILIASLVTLIIWVSLDILHARSEVKIPPETEQLLEPINPNFDLSGINEF